MIKSHQIKLYPTKSQEVLLKKSFGVARYSFNWALNKWKEMYQNGENPSAYTLIKIQNSIKKEQMPFFLEVSKTAPQYAIHNLQKAFNNFFKKNTKYPKFKKKGRKDSFVSVENYNQFKQWDKKIWLPRIGWIKCAEDLRFTGKVNNVVVKRIANMYFAVVNIETNKSTPILKQDTGDNQSIIGVDLGIKSMIVLSNGVVFENPRALKSSLKSLKRLQRSVSRKVKGSANRKKAIISLSRKHYHVACIRSNAIHNATSFIVRNYDKIIIEDLNVNGMLKNHRLAQAVVDVSFSEIRRQLAYKAMWQQKELVIADRFFASSKICSHCGHKKQSLSLKERTYKCENCGFEIDRDLNAAINLANYSPTAKFAGSYACGDLSSANESLCSESLKQELSETIV